MRSRTGFPDFKATIAAIGGLGVLALLLIHAGARWQWSVLMDDLSYLRLVRDFGGWFGEFISQIGNYWHEGRFYPVKYLVNILKLKYLPLNPEAFHFFGLALYLAIFTVWAGVVMKKLQTPLAAVSALFLVAIFLAQRPLLDTIALNTIAEPWVILFFACGLLLFDERPWLYRLMFLLCGLSKEPGIVVFGASAAVHFWRNPRKRTPYLVDVVIFIALGIVMMKAKNAGTYLQSYSLVALSNFVAFGIGFAKCAIGVMPAVALVVLAPERGRLFPKNALGETRLLSLLFSAGYLYLTAARGTPGYLLIPPAFALSLVAATFVFRPVSKPLARASVIALAAACLVVSLARYERFIRGINESSRAVMALLKTDKPRILVLNGEEVAGALQNEAVDLKTPVKVVAAAHFSPGQLPPLMKKPGTEVVLFEFSSYFGHYGDKAINEFGKAAGGWKSIVDQGVYREFRN